MLLCALKRSWRLPGNQVTNPPDKRQKRFDESKKLFSYLQVYYLFFSGIPCQKRASRKPNADALVLTIPVLPRLQRCLYALHKNDTWRP